MQTNHFRRRTVWLAGMILCAMIGPAQLAVAADLLVVTRVVRSPTGLSIYGHNFDNGNQPVVRLDKIPATLDKIPVTFVSCTIAGDYEYKPDKIEVDVDEADLPADFVGNLLLTVVTGSGWNQSAAYGLMLGGAAWEAPADQVLIRNVDLEFDVDTLARRLTISGSNFLKTGHPPDISTGSSRLEYYSGHRTTDTEIVVNLDPFMRDWRSAFLYVRTGSDSDDRDTYALADYQGSYGKYDDRFLYGKYDGGFLCKIGPPETDISRGALSKEPKYYQLLSDFVIDLPLYLARKHKECYPPIMWEWITVDLGFASFNVRRPITQGRLRNRLFGHAKRLPCVGSCEGGNGCPGGCKTSYSDHDCGQWDFIELSSDGRLTIKKGYRWDGPSTEPIPSPPELLRATLVHDALYDLMRLEKLARDPTCKLSEGKIKNIVEEPHNSAERDGWWNRLLADCLMYMLGVEDEHGFDAFPYVEFLAVRTGGADKVRFRPIACWQYHAVASAGEDMVLYNAPPEGLLVDLDGSGSRFARSWEWYIDGAYAGDTEQLSALLAPGVHRVKLVVDDGNDDAQIGDESGLRDSDEMTVTIFAAIFGGPGPPGGGPAPPEPPVFDPVEDLVVSKDPDVCSAIVEFDVTATDDSGDVPVVCNPASGSVFPVGIQIVECTATDAAGNTATTTFTVTVKDDQPPVIAVNTTPINLWPPNHKYVTFTVEDFVPAVWDNCGGLSPADVVILLASSNEPDDADGHGGGKKKEDIVISADGKSVDLMSERQARGDGRIYTIHLAVVDSAANASVASVEVHVARPAREEKEKPPKEGKGKGKKKKKKEKGSSVSEVELQAAPTLAPKRPKLAPPPDPFPAPAFKLEDAPWETDLDLPGPEALIPRPEPAPPFLPRPA
ncbi:MAG: HYR domain-containing protein [Planctomycetes bacterium]|nr:HYR domain-containing protein [Planctomycetota bacterium]